MLVAFVIHCMIIISIIIQKGCFLIILVVSVLAVFSYFMVTVIHGCFMKLLVVPWLFNGYYGCSMVISRLFHGGLWSFDCYFGCFFISCF